MRGLHLLLSAAAAAMLVSAHPGPDRDVRSSLVRADSLRLASLPDIPDALGRAGMFAGRAGDVLLAAGGANFRDRMPWEGGTKVWHDDVYALREGDAEWRTVGRLPTRNAYGVSASMDQGVLIVGGSDASRHFADAWLLATSVDGVVVRALPALPVPAAQMSGAIVGRTLHIVGGIDRPDATAASAAHHALDLDAPARGWRRLDPIPSEGRILAVAAATRDALYVIGGCTLRADASGRPVRTYLRDVWRYRAAQWARAADLPVPLAAAASPAPVFGDDLLVVGGDDGAQVGRAPAAHVGFTRRLLRYDVSRDRWRTADHLAHDAPVTLPAAPWAGGFALVSGEVRPGVRTPRVILLQPRDR